MKKLVRRRGHLWVVLLCGLCLYGGILEITRGLQQHGPARVAFGEDADIWKTLTESEYRSHCFGYAIMWFGFSAVFAYGVVTSWREEDAKEARLNHKPTPEEIERMREQNRVASEDMRKRFYGE